MADQLYKGAWINWSHGLIGGMTITINDRAGGLLTAFIATFVTIAGAELWKILCYVAHQLRSTTGAQDGLYHQQQVIFRTSTTPGGAAWLFLQQTWFWAGKARLAVLRTLPWACFSILYILAVGLMAIFSSEVSKSPGPTRLLAADRCGTWSLNTSSPDSLSAWQSKVTNDSLNAASYARACYSSNPDPLRCGRYPVPAINWTSNGNASCPFESGMCVYGDKAAFSMTTDMIDSHVHLGINAPTYDRVQLQKITTCAPLRAKKFATMVNVTEDNGEPGQAGDLLYKFWFGALLGKTAAANTTDYTWFYNTHSWLDGFGYTLSAYTALAGYPRGFGVFAPVSEINSSSADLSLMFIAANSVRFAAPCKDPVFSANILQNTTGYPFWLSDYYASVVACSETYKICNPTNGYCTPYMGDHQLQQAMIQNGDGLELNAKQNATAFRLSIAMYYSSIYHATFTRGGGSLRATETVSQLSQAALPPNQWHIEVGSWFDAGLARLQAGTQEYVTNPSNIVPGSYLNRFAATAGDPWYEACFQQFVKGSPGTMSFSVIGLVILFALGGLVIFTSLTIDTVVGFIQGRTGFGLHCRVEWLVNDKLHMQRLLFREMKLGQWYDGLDKRIPVTVGGRQQFQGPAAGELATEDAMQWGGETPYDGSNVELVGEEHIQGGIEKGWTRVDGGSVQMTRLR